VNDEIGRMTTLLNEMLERLHAALEANRRFAADASHELRSPLTAMAGEIDVALMRQRSPDEYRETLTVVRERLDELVALTENLMLLVRAAEPQHEVVVKEVALRPLLEDAVSRTRSAARARNITVELAELPPLVVYGDARLLARVFDNVVTNAVQYNRQAGRVTIRGRVEDALPDAWETGSVVVTVADTGSGIPREYWQKVFDRFYRLDRSRSRRTGGTGLGLALCRTIVGLFRGSIVIAASSPEGTTFEIRLPGQRLPAQPLKPLVSEIQAS
ncbi:MAG: sensor histidine kinase, partial [Vicinamibacterales bacterium]